MSVELAEKIAEYENSKSERDALNKEIEDKKAVVKQLDGDIDTKRKTVAELDSKINAAAEPSDVQ